MGWSVILEFEKLIYNLLQKFFCRMH